MRCCRAVDKRGAGEACDTPMINRHLSSFDMIRIFKCNRGLTFFDFKTHPLQLQEGPRLHLKMRMQNISSDLALLDVNWPPPTSMLNIHAEMLARDLTRGGQQACAIPMQNHHLSPFDKL